jgi:CDP-4-dehydro-6-deoxyglucose reductase
VAAGSGAGDPRGKIAIALRPFGDVVAGDMGESVLGALLRSGAKVVFGCRGGGCGACKMRLAAGRVDHGRCSVAVLPEAERAQGWFLSCQARPLGDISVELTGANGYRPPSAWRRRLATEPPEGGDGQDPGG